MIAFHINPISYFMNAIILLVIHCWPKNHHTDSLALGCSTWNYGYTWKVESSHPRKCSVRHSYVIVRDGGYATLRYATINQTSEGGGAGDGEL